MTIQAVGYPEHICYMCDQPAVGVEVSSDGFDTRPLCAKHLKQPLLISYTFSEKEWDAVQKGEARIVITSRRAEAVSFPEQIGWRPELVVVPASHEYELLPVGPMAAICNVPECDKVATRRSLKGPIDYLLCAYHTKEDCEKSISLHIQTDDIIKHEDVTAINVPYSVYHEIIWAMLFAGYSKVKVVSLLKAIRNET